MSLCGIDEAGRGALAGPLVVVGVVLDKEVEGLKDSKKLTPKRREELYQKIVENGRIYKVIISNEEIDKKGLSLCLKEALESIKKELFARKYLFDGNCNFGVEGIEVKIKADDSVEEVMAASIIAKVCRDRIMCRFDTLFPEYRFCRHKGYGTKEHLEAIKKFGCSPIHRKSFRKVQGGCDEDKMPKLPL
ncbi:MAG: ribonuclease HII [Epsilonproteobacteria bacterium]|nr:ribonuclease HII [Campylobacterota bacterium]